MCRRSDTPMQMHFWAHWRDSISWSLARKRSAHPYAKWCATTAFDAVLQFSKGMRFALSVDLPFDSQGGHRDAASIIHLLRPDPDLDVGCRGASAVRHYRHTYTAMGRRRI